MSGPFSNIGIIGKPGDPKVKTTVRTLADHLLGHGLEVTAEVHTHELLESASYAACTLARLGENSDLVIVVGGDGTLLGAARALAPQNVPLLGVNLGRLGFLVDISPERMLDAVDRILAGDFVEERRFLLNAGIGVRQGDASYTLAFNDVVLHKWNTPRMVEFETYIDGQFVNGQRSDGLIVSTPSGSTAYALSGGGPLLHPSLDAVLLVPICPHTLSHRPIVVSGDSTIEIRISSGDHQHSRISCDGQTDQAMEVGKHLFIEKYPQPLRLLHPKDHDHFEILRAKLGWGGHPIP